MICCVTDVIRVIEKVAPAELAASWDNAGLQVGDPAWPVHLIWVALDPLPEVVSKACAADVDLLVTHHPLIFKPLKHIDVAKPEGAMIAAAIQHHMAIYAAHTNLDAVQDGINDVLAAKIGIKDIAMLNLSPNEDVQNLGRIGFLPRETTLISFAREIKGKLGVAALKIAGEPNLTVRRAFICAGSGSSLLSEFLRSEADVFISGDIKYHDARAIEAAGKGLVDIGHFASEHVMVEELSRRIGQLLTAEETAVTVKPYLLEKDPFMVI